MDTLLLILIALLLASGVGGYYVGRPGYGGVGAGWRNILYTVGTMVLIVVVLRLLRIF